MDDELNTVSEGHGINIPVKTGSGREDILGSLGCVNLAHFDISTFEFFLKAASSSDVLPSD